MGKVETDTYTAKSEDVRRDKLMNMAITHGVKVGAATLVVASAATFLVNKRFAGFRNYGSINAKVSIPVIIAMFTTSVVTELGIHDARYSPEKWDGGKPYSVTKAIAPKVTDLASLGLHKQLLLKIYDSPLVFAGALSLPLAGNILYTRFAKSHLSFSQALMQTRVFAQFGIISILMSTVSIRLFVDANDHFGCKQKHLTDEDRYTRGWAADPSSVTDADEKDSERVEEVTH